MTTAEKRRLQCDHATCDRPLDVAEVHSGGRSQEATSWTDMGMEDGCGHAIPATILLLIKLFSFLFFVLFGHATRL